MRLSVLMGRATTLIEEASELAGEGKTSESVEKYRKALLELDRIEMENPERAKTPEFATIRNKRAYVNAAIDAMLLEQVRANAKAVAVSDTSELEKRLAEERGDKKPEEEVKPEEAAKPAEKPAVQEGQAEKPQLSKREQAMAAIEEGNFSVAKSLIQEMLAEKPNGAMALNLKAMLESRQGNYREAESALDQAINANPRNYFAYYNMAVLMLQVNPGNREIPKRYYDTGRSVGGPRDEQLEAQFK